MNPASTRRGSSHSTSRPGVLGAPFPLESQGYVASAAPRQRPSVPGIPISQRPSVPGTPISQRPSVPGTPISRRPSVPGTPISRRPSVPGTPSRLGPSVPGTPTSPGPSVPGTPISQGPSVPGTPSRQRSFVRATPSIQRLSVPPSSQRPLVRGTSSTRSLQSVHRDPIADKLPKKYTQHEKVPSTRPLQGTKKPETPQTQAEGLDRDVKRFRESFWHFCFSPNGMLKVLRMCLTATSVFCFIIGGAQDMFVAIVIQETCIVLFFIIIYLVILQNTMTCIHWPLLDLINTLISMVFLGIVGMLVIGEKNTEDLGYIGGVLCLSAAVLCVIDALLVTEKMRRRAKTALAKETKPSATGARQKQR
ncbi:CKLF-like MARVEL transmembrane domain-containing protein 1 [Arvicanthis niloticus]|uniref:CKLF-like MARVEL transmembrane domain-containing protein 1 n=1 Tax=Arvicanthis niloticus TaxID=61156 RepID=UPI00148662FE|nr:enamelin-like [Arvicanthis niloticus]